MNLLHTLCVRTVTLSLLLTPLALPAEEPSKPPGAFQDESTIVFLGDSITYQAHFAEYTRGFFHTRYPDRRFHFVNAGIPGQKAEHALTRFEYDVARFKPALVVVMFGMNDGQYQELDAEDNLTAYQTNMTELVKRIKAIGAKPIMMSPTPFDAQTSQTRQDDPTYRFKGKEFSANYNYLLAYYGAWNRDLAAREGGTFINAYGPMNDFIYQQRRSEPGFTLMPDAIHPDPAGHFLMTFSLISGLTPDRTNTAQIVLTQRGDQWKATSRSAEIKELESKDGHISFQAKARALPWVIPEKHTLADLRWNNPSNGRAMYKATKAGHKLSSEMIKVAGLAPGNYSIKIDGEEVASSSHIKLGTKLEIQENEKTPQYQQALEVAHLNLQLSDEVVRPLRDLISRRLNAEKKSPDALAAFEKKNAGTIEALEQKRGDFEDMIHEAAQPRWHRFEINLVK